MPTDAKRSLVEPEHERLSIARQCQLLGMSRAAYYYEPWEWDETALEILREIDEEYTRHPFLGKRRMCDYLQELGYAVGVKRTRTLMAHLGLEAICPKKNTSVSNREHKKYPYLLKKLPIVRPNQVWASDITYVRQRRGFAYLTVVMDWFSRYVIAWELSTTLDSDFCVRCLQRALEAGRPEIFNTDQGSQYTSEDFTKTLLAADVRISMNGAGRVFDNIMVERLWRSVKQEEVYLKEYEDAGDCRENLDMYFAYYNHRRCHSQLDARPAEIYFDAICRKAS
jgi:putative transposase